MQLRHLIGASALALLTSTAFAQAASGPGSGAAATPSSSDPYVQKRIENHAAKQEYKAAKKAAKKDYKQEKRENQAQLKQDLKNQPTVPGTVGTPGEYGQSPTQAGLPGNNSSGK